MWFQTTLKKIRQPKTPKTAGFTAIGTLAAVKVILSNLTQLVIWPLERVDRMVTFVTLRTALVLSIFTDLFEKA
jgi:uncharacterized membrane protein AbrB (regulator of aidB expression)